MMRTSGPASSNKDALIIGAGPAGTTLSIALAKEGHQVTLVEKSKGAEHKVCGDFLSPECLKFLRRIHLHPESLGAQSIHSVRIAARDIIAEATLPACALSLTRWTLDSALQRIACASGVNLLRGHTVDHLHHDGDAGWRAQATTHRADNVKAPVTLSAHDVFLATGKHDLRGWARTTEGTHNSLVAFKMYFALAPDQQAQLNGHVELILYPGGYAGLQPVEDGCANLCALISQKKLCALGGRWEALLEHMQRHAPHLAKRLSGATPMLHRPLAISSIPYGYCVQAEQHLASPWKLGDQAAVIPSFCGDGIAIALHSADRAAELYLGGATSADFHAEMRHHFRRRLGLTSRLSQVLVAMPSLAHAVRMWPSALTQIFTATRLPNASYARAGER